MDNILIIKGRRIVGMSRYSGGKRFIIPAPIKEFNHVDICNSHDILTLDTITYEQYPVDALGFNEHVMPCVTLPEDCDFQPLFRTPYPFDRYKYEDLPSVIDCSIKRL